MNYFTTLSIRIAGYKCRCDMNPIDCSAYDQYAPVLECDALDAAIDVKCTYSKSVGTKYSQSVNESMSLDASIEEELKLQYYKRFYFGVGISVETGYDWTHVSSEAREYETTIEVRT